MESILPRDLINLSLSYLPPYMEEMVQSFDEPQPWELQRMASKGLVEDERLLRWAMDKGLARDDRLLANMVYHGCDPLPQDIPWTERVIYAAASRGLSVLMEGGTGIGPVDLSISERAIPRVALILSRRWRDYIEHSDAISMINHACCFIGGRCSIRMYRTLVVSFQDIILQSRDREMIRFCLPCFVRDMFCPIQETVTLAVERGNLILLEEMIEACPDEFDWDIWLLLGELLAAHPSRELIGFIDRGMSILYRDSFDDLAESFMGIGGNALPSEMIAPSQGGFSDALLRRM